MNLFTKQIDNWRDWDKVSQSIPAFSPLIKQIFEKENLPFSTIENLEPGTNAVFKIGEYAIKIFAPAEACGRGITYGTDIDVELFGIKFANARGVPAPKADCRRRNRRRIPFPVHDYGVHPRKNAQRN